MTIPDDGRVPLEPGSRASTEPRDVSALSGFDPSRIEQIIGRLSPARLRNLKALGLGWQTISEMRHKGATGSGMDVLYAMERPRLCERQWARWGSEPGQTRGEGYEYRLTPLGKAVREAIAMEARSGETEGLDPQGDSAGQRHRPDTTRHSPHNDKRKG